MSDDPDGAPGARRGQLKAEFIESRGYWSDFWEGLLALDPDYFEAFTRLSGIPWQRGPLPVKYKELIALAIDAAVTHLYEPGIRAHVRNAMNHGATKEEILEVFEIVSCMGIHASTVGLPIFVEELAAHSAEAPSPSL